MAGRSREFVILSVYFFLLTGSFGFLQPFLPLYMEAAGLDRAQVGLILGLAAGLALVVQPLLGRLTDRLDSRKPVIFASSLFAFLSLSAFPWIGGLGLFLAAGAVANNGILFLNSAGGVLAGRLASEGSGGASYAECRLWGSVGYILTSIGSGFLVLQTGSQGITREALNPIFHWGSLLFLAISLMALILPDSKTPGAATTGPLAKAPLPDNLKWFLASYFLYTFALYGASGFLSIHLKAMGAQGLAITLVFAAGVLVEVFVMRWVGRFSDRFGRRPALAVAFLILPPRLLLYTLPWGPGWVMAVQSLHGFNFGIMGAVAIVMANDLTGDKTRGQAQARIFATAGAANAISPILFGAIAKQAGMSWMFVCASVIALFAAALFLFKVEDSLPQSEPLASRFPAPLRGLASWLDSPRGPKGQGT